MTTVSAVLCLVLFVGQQIGISQFAQKFRKATLDLNPGRNMVTSPLSADMALTLLSLGAEGETLAELDRALYLPSKDFIKEDFEYVNENLKYGREAVILNFANKVFVKKSDTFTLSALFNKDAVDFANSTQAAHIINSWVEKKTDGKIKDFISPDSLNSQTKLVLVNAVYFRGVFVSFAKDYTVKRDFFVTATEKIQVDTMYDYNYIRYAEFSDWDAKAIMLSFGGYLLSIAIILPNNVEGLAALEEKLATEDADIQSHLKMLSPKWMTVYLPKIKIETTVDLTEVLPKTGITKIFDDGAQLGGLLDGDGDLAVSQAVQKVFFEVIDEGLYPYPPYDPSSRKHEETAEQFTFEANHPFHFLVLNLYDDVGTLFAGRFVGG